MALDGTYAGLQASVASWLKRTDMTTVIASDLIVLGEQRISRDLRLRNQMTVSTLVSVPQVQAVALPANYLEGETLTLQSGTNPAQMLQYVTPEKLNTQYATSSSYVSQPCAFTILGTNILLGPVPDSAYTLTLAYYAKFPALSATPTNWLLSNHAGIYLYGALAEAGDFVQNPGLVAQWETKYAKLVEDLQAADDNAGHSGAALRVRRG